MASQKYNFQYLPIKDLYSFLGIFIGGVFMVILATIVLEAYNLENTAGFFLMAYLVIWFLGIGYYLFRLLKNNSEEISFTRVGFRSRLFGELRYKEVTSYKVTNGLSRFLFMDNPAPSLLIILQGGKKIRINLHPKNYDEDIDTFMAFSKRFVDDMGAIVFEQTGERSEIHRRIPGESEVESVSSNLHDDLVEARAGLAEIRDRIGSKTKYRLIIRIAYIIVMLIIVCMLIGN